MPLYEYECSTCHRRTEKIQKFSDPEITVCPHCGGPLARVLSAPAVSFKGGGWYADGYASAKSAGAAKPSSGTPSASSSESSSSAPAAPAAPASSTPAKS